ncbi:hypothetical protein [Paraburkholderia sp. BCC1884]|uniref:hypothetical protein n=1 Tax=Paraburkholderia sp. BCC1884 TaxID=2562668 RepID=UPI0011826D46|nr:hypothetical protein [Paraburkholderia sp. BCC1884]
MAKANPVSSEQQVAPASSQIPAPVCGDPYPANRKCTPEATARKVLMLERARQQAVIIQMEAVHAEMCIMESVLRELMSDQAFVALLRRQGFLTMPRQLRDRLGGWIS